MIVRQTLALALLTALAGAAAPYDAQAQVLGQQTQPPAATKAVALVPFYVRHARGRNADVERELRGQGGEITYYLDQIGTFVVNLPETAANALAANSQVTLIERVPEHRLQAQVVPWNIDQYQARDVWDKNRDGVVDVGAPDGSGITICIIDTGFHIGHSDFVGITVNGTGEGNVGNWFEDGNGHGTHVAGTVNAVNNTRGVVGVLPGAAELYIVKVFNNAGGWGGGSLATAADKCRLGGANVISMSLGGGASQTEENMFQNLYDNFGILNVAAAGNDGNDVPSAPAMYESVVMVAAINEEETAAEFSQTPPTAFDPNNPPANVEWDMVEFAGGGVQVLSTVPSPDGEVPNFSATANATTYFGGQIAETPEGNVTFPLVDGGLCRNADPVQNWTDRVVLCQRGDVAFSEKVNRVRNQGGRATIIYNNIPGDFGGTCAGGCTNPSIPAISLSQAKGQALLADALGDATNVVVDDGAPCVGCEGGYAFYNGTSMATPGVSAGMAFVWNACGGPTSVTNKQLRQLLRDTAKDLVGVQPFDPQAGESAGDEIPYGVGYDRVTGWGIPQLADALELGNARFGNTCPLALIATPAVRDICTLNSTSTTFTMTLDDQFVGSSTLSATGVPAGATGSFNPNPVVNPATTSTYTLSNLDAAAAGNYELDFSAVDDANPNNIGTASTNLNLTTALPGTTTQIGPADGATGVSTLPTLNWSAAGAASEYLVQVATDAAFTTIVHSASVTGTSHAVSTMLATNTQYFWRVTPTNFCGTSTPPVASFTTQNIICSSPNVAIPDHTNPGGGTNGVVTDTLNVPTGAALGDMNLSVGITHTFVGDLLVSLRHVQTNKTVVVIDRPGRTTGGNGCSGNNISATLDDEAAAPVESQCAGTVPTINGTFTPNNPLSLFDGDNLAGDWVLTVTDAASGDTGTLNNWCLAPTDNGAPLFTSSPVTAVNEDAVYTYNITATDPNGTAGLTLTAPTRPAWLTFTPGANGTATLSGTPTNAEVGVHNVTLRVSDGIAAPVDQVFTVTVSNVNDAPTFTSSPVTAATEDTLYTYNITTADVDAGASLTLSAPTLPGWLTFTPGANGAGSLSGTPTNAEVGTHNVTLQVTDGIAAPVDQGFVITVANANDAPTFTSVPVTAATEDAAYTYNITTSDVDVGDTLTLTAPTLPAWLIFTPGANGAGSLSGTPTNAEVGTHNVTLQVSDGIAPPVDQSFVITVTNANDAPTFTSLPVTAATEGVAYAYNITTSDVDVGAALTLTAPVLPAWLIFTPGPNGTGSLNGTPTNAEVGTHNVTLQVSDGIAAPVDQSFVITVGNVNNAPTVDTPIPDQSNPEGTLINLSVAGNFADIDVGQSLSFSTLSTLPSGLSFNASGTFSGTIDFTAAAGSPYTITVTADDSNGGTVSDTFVWTVTDVSLNQPPAFTNEPYAFDVVLNAPASTAVGSVSATDPNLGDTLTFAITGGNTGNAFAIDPSTGAITVATSAAVAPVNTVFTLSVSVSDGNGGSDTGTVSIRVISADGSIFADGFEN